MASRHILLLDAHGLKAFSWRPEGPREEFHFAPTEAGNTAFRDYLLRLHDDLFYLLVDVAEEGFQTEELPYVQGNDRRVLLQRKLSQMFYGTPLAMAMSLGRSRAGRRDERFLFAGLTGPDQIEPWLDAVREAKAQLVGVYSLPQVITTIFSGVGKGLERALIISVEGGGLRQTYFDNGQLRFSRLTPMEIGSMAAVAATCAIETGKIQQYLASQRLIARDTELMVLVLAHPGEFNEFRRVCADTPERRVQLLDIEALGRAQGLKRPLSNSNGERLFVHLLAKRQPHHQFANAQDRRRFHLRQVRLAINAVSAVILAGGLVYGATKAFDLIKLRSENELARTDLQLAQRRHDAMLEGLPAIPITLEDLRALTDKESLLVRRSPGLLPLLRHISEALNRNASIDLAGLHWRLSNSPEEPVPVAPGSMGTGSRTTSALPNDVYAIVDLRVQLPVAMAHDHRKQLESMNGFIAALSSSAVQVRVISLPFETESGKSIRSGEIKAETDAPRAALRLVRRL